MPILEHIKTADSKKLEQLGYPYKIEHPKETGNLQSNTLMQKCIDERMKQDISAISREISQAHNSYNDAEELPIGEAVANVASEWLKSVRRAKEKKVILSVPLNPGRGSAIMDSLIYRLNHLTNKDDNIKGDDKRKLEPVWSEIYDLVSKGSYVSKEMLKLLPEDTTKKHEDYLSRLKQIVCNSIEKGKKEDVAVERDNGFFCVECPEESVITPAKFLSNPEFENLYGALKIGKGDDIIRTKNGQYCDMKGALQMAFEVGDSEKIEMILLSENSSGFGKIMVHMDDKSCEIFLKHCEELKKEPRISKVVEAAESFVQKNKTVSPPFSSMGDTNTSNHLENIGQSASQNVGNH
ncbi:hypothetical protein [Wolbachia endosymbiont of Ctenocephalides felis wCfeJ]|uniref:hypothetical protein n=1 Tax=Wolbachia endosymbiont of Ctenocephalides felis wCfeJ TaxID=2732594 RepID=UPI001FEA5FD5|nr:hypothetical protein [Wolbachia endosymbiont of Ctenocephalides felis wCfeJ]WCR58146.1 MAG: hypothetical protein PG980_000618 [Wolbachia endosymbiont of Ctenocephalides felis wCfeJ]